MERGLLRGGWRESSVSGCASFCIDRRGLDVNARRVRSWKARGVRRALSGRVGDIISSSSMVSGVECRNVRSRSFMSWTFDRDQFRVYRDGCTSRQESSTRFHLFFDHVLSIFHFISFFYCPPYIIVNLLAHNNTPDDRHQHLFLSPRFPPSFLRQSITT